MSGASLETLYNLLPALYRLRDAAEGEPLRALLGVLERERQAIEDDVAGLYDNWFIETCADWIVPYIGDLLGVRGLHPIDSAPASPRAYVANTLAYRRRKGTAAVLEQLAHDTTGWPARVVEFFQSLSTTQHLNHVRPDHVRTPDLRDTRRLELLAGPFARAAHTAEVRRIRSRRGRYHPAHIGLFVWRLQSYPVTRSTARAIDRPEDGRYTFNPLGLDQPLFNLPQTETEITRLAGEVNVPGLLRRRALYDELESRRRALAAGTGAPPPVYFGLQPVLQVFLDGRPAPVPAEEILICDLSQWQAPPEKVEHAGPEGEPVTLPIQVAVDPVLGRLSFPAGSPPSEVHVSYAYGFSGDVGGGPYGRPSPALAARPNHQGWARACQDNGRLAARPITWRMAVSQAAPPVEGERAATLAEAVQAWNAQPAGTVGAITILDSRTYTESLIDDRGILIPEGSALSIAAADGVRPHWLGNLSVRGNAPAGSPDPGRLRLEGLLLEGSLTIGEGSLGGLHLAHCTLVPGRGTLSAVAAPLAGDDNPQLQVRIERSICGAIVLPDAAGPLSVIDSIVAGGAAGDGTTPAIEAPSAAAHIQRTTVLGGTHVRSLEADSSLFTGPVHAVRRQIGCVRFSYLPASGSQTPVRFRCQPDLARAGVSDPVDLARIDLQLAPTFTSTRYGDPGYAQLGPGSADAICSGAEDGAEMGAFNHLKQPQRLANLYAGLEEYLRVGLEAGIFFVT